MMTSWVLVSNIPKYVKLAKLTMVQVVGSMEVEICLSILTFMKSSFTIGSLPLAICCTHVFTTNIYFVKFHICKLY
jgi:uncharacterized membrane protein